MRQIYGKISFFAVKPLRHSPVHETTATLSWQSNINPFFPPAAAAAAADVDGFSAAQTRRGAALSQPFSYFS